MTSTSAASSGSSSRASGAIVVSGQVLFPSATATRSAAHAVIVAVSCRIGCDVRQNRRWHSGTVPHGCALRRSPTAQGAALLLVLRHGYGFRWAGADSRRILVTYEVRNHGTARRRDPCGFGPDGPRDRQKPGCARA